MQTHFHGYSKEEERMALIQGKSEAYIEGNKPHRPEDGNGVGVVSGSALTSNSVQLLCVTQGEASLHDESPLPLVKMM